MPRSLDPETQDRTATIAPRQALVVKPVSTVGPATASMKKVEDGGWRAGK